MYYLGKLQLGILIKQTVSTVCSFHSFDLGVGGQKNNYSYFLDGHKQDSDLFSDKTAV